MIKIKTMLLVREYKEIDRSSIDGQIKCAFVVFKSMEGCERLIQAYQNRQLKRILARFFPCCRDVRKYE